MGVLAVAMFGGMGIALGQGVVNVDTPDLDKAIHAMEVQSEETGREMVGEVIPAEVDFFEVATRAVKSGMEVWTLQVSLPVHSRAASISTISICPWAPPSISTRRKANTRRFGQRAPSRTWKTTPTAVGPTTKSQEMNW